MKWISVEERLPERGDTVIGFYPNKSEDGRFVAEAYFNGKSLISNQPTSTAYYFKATHWMPLPPPPKTK